MLYYPTPGVILFSRFLIIGFMIAFVYLGLTAAGSGEYAVGDGVTSALLSVRLPLKLTP